MSWLVYGAVAYLAYKLVAGGHIKVPTDQKKVRKKKKKKKKVRAATPETVNGRSPHDILGVEPGASVAEIRRAYQDLMSQYHPDRVANAADELQQLAEQRSKEINAAYAMLTK